MKSIKDLREEYNLITESDSKSSKKMTIATIPTLVVLKRRAIRVFPGGRQVGLYYAQQIDKFVTIPFGDENDRENKKVINVFEELEQIDEISDRLVRRAIAKGTEGAYLDKSSTQRNKKGKSVGKLAAALYSKKVKSGKSDKEASNSVEHAGKVAGRWLQKISNHMIKEDIPSSPMNPKRRKTAGIVTPASDIKNTLGNRNYQIPPGEAPEHPPSKNKKKKTVKIPYEPPEHNGSTPKKLKKSKVKGNAKKGPEAAQDRLASRSKKLLNRKYNTLSNTQKKFLTPKRAMRDTFNDTGSVSDALSVGLVTHLLAKKNPIKESTQVQLDGNTFEINTNIAEKLVSVYDTLNEQNKKKMIDMLMNEDTQSKIIEFVTRY